MGIMLLSDRILADIRNRDEWEAAREGRIGASDAASYAKEESWPLYMKAKLEPSWGGGQYADWGNEREAIILKDIGRSNNHSLFHSLDNPRHVATPDSITLGPNPFLTQVKTTSKDWISKRTGEILVPPTYRRQVLWELYVMGPEFEYADLRYERHHDFVPEFEAKTIRIDRDDEAISKLIRIANLVLDGLDRSAF